MDENYAQQLNDQNKETYNTIASLFSSTRGYLWDELKHFMEYIKDGDRVLDVGCGNGRLYQAFKDLQVSYVGVDLSEELIKIAQEKVPEGEFHVTDMTHLPFEDNSFDNVFSIAAFHHLPSVEMRETCLSEMARVLKPSGHLLMTNWNLHSKFAQKTVEKGKWRIEGSRQDFILPWYTGQKKVLGERYYYGFYMEELEKLFEQAGFAVEDQFFIKKGKRADVVRGFNIISIVRKR